MYPVSILSISFNITLQAKSCQEPYYKYRKMLQSMQRAIFPIFLDFLREPERLHVLQGNWLSSIHLTILSPLSAISTQLSTGYYNGDKSRPDHLSLFLTLLNLHHETSFHHEGKTYFVTGPSFCCPFANPSIPISTNRAISSQQQQQEQHAEGNKLQIPTFNHYIYGI